MTSSPQPATALVEAMTAAAAAAPERAVAFQGAPGCNSHRAVLEYAPDSLPLPCFAFEDALDAVTSELAATEEFEYAGWETESIADMLAALSDLARLAESQGQGLFVWLHPLRT